MTKTEKGRKSVGVVGHWLDQSRSDKRIEAAGHKAMVIDRLAGQMNRMSETESDAKRATEPKTSQQTEGPDRVKVSFSTYPEMPKQMKK